ncbi:hypothetical protein D3C73_632330 [compost metagenome]
MIKENVLNASVEELKRGYIEDEDSFTCIFCGTTLTKGIIYSENGVLYEAVKFVRVHITNVHQSTFEMLLHMDKSLTGLSDIQRNILELFYQGKSDTEVQTELGTGSTSTIRNHRFMLKEKERQAKVFLAIMELLKANDVKGKSSSDSSQRTLPKYADEREKVLKKYFPGGPQGPLTSFSMKEKHKRIVLRELVTRFENKRFYTEKEVNHILEAAFEDYAVLRRYLVEYGYMLRLSDGSQYWLNEEANTEEENSMNRKDELKLMSKEIKTEAGIYQIKNKQNGKILIEGSANLKSINGKQFQLEMGGHMNKALQQEWNQYGKDAFEFEVLEVLKKKDDEFFDSKDALQKLKDKWMEELQPFGERGYN